MQTTCSEVGVVPFEISDCQPDLNSGQNSQKNEESPSSDKNNPKQLVNRKRKCSGETADIRGKGLIVQHEYDKKRKTNESEECKQKRLAQQRENKRNIVQVSLLNLDEKDWQVNLCIKENKITNASVACRWATQTGKSTSV